MINDAYPAVTGPVTVTPCPHGAALQAELDALRAKDAPSRYAILQLERSQ